MSHWRDQAACVGKDTNLWFADRGSRDQIRALTICAQCEVKVQCAIFAIDGPEHEGVWGGMTPDQRRDLRHNRRAYRALKEEAI